MVAILQNASPKSLVRIGTIAFTMCIGFAYALYPHWITLSDFVGRWYTLILFVIAMLIAILELWYLGRELRRHPHFQAGANTLYVSAVCACLILCVPYTGSAPQKDIHDAIGVLFVIFAASGFALIAKRLRNYPLGSLSGLMFGLCVLELIFLARYKAHPVHAWAWTVMELTGIAMMMAALYIIGGILEKEAQI
jgi:hypothetical protein